MKGLATTLRVIRIITVAIVLSVPFSTTSSLTITGQPVFAQTSEEYNQQDSTSDSSTHLKEVDEDYFISQNIPNLLDFDCSKVGISGSFTLAGDNNMEKIWNFLIGKGLSSEQAAGVMGNIGIESGNSWSPFVQEVGQSWGSGGYGLVQWTGSRRDELVNAMRNEFPADVFNTYYSPQFGTMQTSAENGYIPEGVSVEVNDLFLSFELEYLYQESTTRIVVSGYGDSGESEWSALTKATSIKQASDIWLMSFERPRDQSETAKINRAELGKKILSQLSGSADPSLSSTMIAADVCESPGIIPGDFASLVLGYAWPEYRGSGFAQKTPAYTEAIERAQADGQYIGGCIGVDCGAFVSRLVIDSGLDPNYNSAGRGGNTDSQQAWLNQNWQLIGMIGDENFDVSILRAGDVAMQPGHTFIYVGEVPGFGSNIASASLCDRAPMAGTESLTGSGTMWYRKR